MEPEIFRDVLVAKGYRALEATTGGEAIARATEQAPDLLLIDIQLPDLDRVEALRRLRTDAAHLTTCGSRAACGTSRRAFGTPFPSGIRRYSD